MKAISITTPRLNLESATPRMDHLREMIGWLNDPITMRYSEQRHKHHTVDTQADYINLFDGDNILLSIFHNGTLIGTVSAVVDAANAVANVGILIGDKSRWGHGFGLEAWQAACDYQLDNGCRKVEAGCMEANLAMMRICSHYGMMEEGRQDDHFIYNGYPIDLVHWGKFK